MIEFPDIAFERTQEHFLKRTIRWMIDWKYRKIVNLKSWVKEQVDFPSQELVDYAGSIGDGNDFDEMMRNILIAVNTDLKYITDKDNWDIDEYWQTAHQTLTTLRGDCEDSTILMYVIARLKGIPANRFLIFAGDVEGGGHCWLGYKPSFNPIVFGFMDWCYYINTRKLAERPLFFIVDKKIHQWGNANPKYKVVWFGFNEEVAYTEFKLRID